MLSKPCSRCGAPERYRHSYCRDCTRWYKRLDRERHPEGYLARRQAEAERGRQPSTAFCACGCGAHPLGKNRFLHGHAARVSVAERFRRYVDKSGDCWIWTGPRNHDGYGVVYLGRGTSRRSPLAHRVTWEALNGAIPEGLSVCHHCDNPPCVNPAHLWLGTHAENMQDRDKKGRGQRAVEQLRQINARFGPRARLNIAQVREIREQSRGGVSGAALAKAYGVSDTAISRIVLGQTYVERAS